MKYKFFSLIVCLTVTTSLQAQERTASGPLINQETWHALQNALESTNGNLKIISIDLTAIKACGAQGKIWTGPGCTGPDMDLYDKLVTCADAGKLYDKSAKACVMATTACVPETFKIYISHSHGKALICPAKSVLVSDNVTTSGASHEGQWSGYFTCLRLKCN